MTTEPQITSNELTRSEMPLISVIVTARNEKDTIEECIKSIFDQDYPNFEVVFVDARSTDGSYDKAIGLTEYSRSRKNCKNFLCLSMDASTPGLGRNIGVKSAFGSIIAFTDADCYARQDWLSRLVKYLADDCGMVGGPNILRHFRSSKILYAIDKVLGTYLGSGGSPQFLNIEKTTEVYAIPACNMAIRKDMFLQIGGFDSTKKYNEDSDLCRRIRERGWKIVYTPEAKVDHYIGIDSFFQLGKFFYKYGFERGKNVAKNIRLLTKFNCLSIAFIALILSLGIMSIFISALIGLWVSIISAVILIIIIVSAILAAKARSLILGIVAPAIFASIHVTYNIGFLVGLLASIKNIKLHNV